MKIHDLPTPCYVIDEKAIEKNCQRLKYVMERTGCRILLAQKAFSCYALYPLIRKYLAGTTASGLFEARVGYEYMGLENHVFAPAYKEEDMAELVRICDHIVFNSIAQLQKYRHISDKVSIGLRINPECSTQEGHAIYDPCTPGSRLGVVYDDIKDADLTGVSGLHFHTLCEQNADALKVTLDSVEARFGDMMHRMKWINMGGGHHITRDDYDVECLIECVNHIKDTYGVDVYLEPGEAIALNAGYLVTTVLDIVSNSGVNNLILDASAACHMPDVLEMPYTPPLCEAVSDGYAYRLTGNTCLSGDIIGDYCFEHEVKVGERLTFADMAIYSMVKNNTFNGIPLPSIYRMTADGECYLIKKFSYEDFKGRLS